MMNEETPSRRVVLRGALAAGCGLWLPVLPGCDSKSGANPAASVASPSAAPATTKAPQASVQYQAQPKGEQKCDGCLHFVAASNTCMVVDGPISPEGWCAIWAKR